MKAWLKILSSARSFVRNLFRKQQVEMNLDDEVRAYVHLLTDEKMAGGMNAGEARRAALVEAEGIEQVKQSVRVHRTGADVELFWQDVLFGLRQLRRSPVFASVPLILTAIALVAVWLPATRASSVDPIEALRAE